MIGKGFGLLLSSGVICEKITAILAKDFPLTEKKLKYSRVKRFSSSTIEVR